MSRLPTPKKQKKVDPGEQQLSVSTPDLSIMQEVIEAMAGVLPEITAFTEEVRQRIPKLSSQNGVDTEVREKLDRKGRTGL